LKWSLEAMAEDGLPLKRKNGKQDILISVAV